MFPGGMAAMMVSSAELKEHIQGVRGEVQLLNYEEALAYAKGCPYEHELDKMMNQEKLPFSKAQMYPCLLYTSPSPRD